MLDERMLSKQNLNRYKKALKAKDKKYGRGWAEIEIEKWEKIMQFRAENLATMTPAEEAFSKICQEMKIRYVREQLIVRGRKFFFVDFFLPKLRVGIEIDGDIHKHRQVYDMNRDAAIQQRSFVIQRFNNWTLLNEPHTIKKFLSRLIETRWENVPPCKTRNFKPKSPPKDELDEWKKYW